MEEHQMTTLMREWPFLIWVPAVILMAAEAGSAEPTSHIPVPGVLYFEEIGEQAPVLTVHTDAGVQVTPDPRSVFDRIQAGRPVKVLGWGADYCWVQGRGTRDQVVGWVPTENLTTIPPVEMARYRDKANRILRRSGLVEKGRITVGMTMDQVSAAFGRPSETEFLVDQNERLVRWLYNEYRTRHIFRPTSYLGGLSGPGGYWSSQSLLEATLFITFSEGRVVKIEREVYNESYTNQERLERLNELYGFQSRWSTGLVGFSGPLREVPVTKFGPDRDQYRPTVENQEQVTRINGGIGAPNMIEPQPGQPMVPAGSIGGGGSSSIPKASNPRTVKPGSPGGGRVVRP
jgi:hypothetical protein